MGTTPAPDPAVRRRRLLWWDVAGAGVALAGQAVVLALWPAAHLLMIDLQVYRAGGEHVLHGEPLSAGGVLLDLPFVYPPFAPVVFAPLALLPLAVLKVVWTGAGIGFLVAPVDSAAYWFDGTFADAVRISGVASAANHSPNGLLARPGSIRHRPGSSVRWCSAR